MVGDDIGPPDSAANRADLLSSLTFSIGPVMVRWKLEITRVDDARATSAEVLSRPMLRGRLRRGVRPKAAGKAREPGLGVLGAPYREQADTSPAQLPGYRLASRWADRYPQLLNGENCTVILSDVVGFGASGRNDVDRLIIREALFNMTHAALQGIPSGWSWDDRGDGLLMVIPPSVPTANIVAQLVNELPSALERHNSTHQASTRIQLRVAVCVGPVVSDTMGVSGDAIIASARLVDAPVFKAAIARSTASLGVITSSFVYQAAIEPGPDPAGYSKVQVEVKETSMPAWVKLFGAPIPVACDRVSVRTTSLPGIGG
jgi:hypothetical protein